MASGVDVPERIDKLDASLSFEYKPVRYSIQISNVSFRGSNPPFALNALSGGLSVKDDTLFVDKLAVRTAESSISVDGAVQEYLTTPQFNVRVSSDKVAIPELAELFPALAGVDLQPSFDLKIDGPMDRLAVQMNVQSSAGELSGTLIGDVMEPGYAASGEISP